MIEITNINKNIYSYSIAGDTLNFSSYLNQSIFKIFYLTAIGTSEINKSAIDFLKKKKINIDLVQKIPTKEIFRLAPDAVNWQTLSGTVRHTFTHFHLELKVLKGMAEEKMVADGFWCEIDKLDNYALPTVMKKVCAHAAVQSPGILKPGY